MFPCGNWDPITYQRYQTAMARRVPMRSWSPNSRWLAVAVSTVALFIASIIPSPFRRRPEWKWVGPDKFLHFISHAVYVVNLINAFSVGRRTDVEAAVLAVYISTTHSLVSGRLQKRVPGRAFEPIDVLAGLAGAIFAAIGWCAVNDTSTKERQ